MTRKTNTKKGKPSDNLWTLQMDRDAKLEGWALFNADGVIQIQAIDDPGLVAEELGVKKLKYKFVSDAEAYEFVISRASWGSKSHALALYLDGRHHGDDVYVPKMFAGDSNGKWIKLA